MADRKASRKGLKICCGVTAIFFIVMVIVVTTLALTVFKPKQPNVSAHPTNIENIILSIRNGTLNVTLGMFVTIENPNYGGFKFKNSTAYIDFLGDTIAMVPIEQYFVPARANINLTASADLMVNKLISNVSFWKELMSGSLRLTSNAELHGKVNVLKFLNFGATAYSTCDITVLVDTMSSETNCKSKIKL